MGGKAQLKIWRKQFREGVFARDSNRCKMCGVGADHPFLDAHHITDRNEMPNGGYVKENGISLCPPCHEKAEKFHATGVSTPGFSPEELYVKIGSSKELAVQKAEALSD